MLLLWKYLSQRPVFVKWNLKFITESSCWEFQEIISGNISESKWFVLRQFQLTLRTKGNDEHNATENNGDYLFKIRDGARWWVVRKQTVNHD